MLAKRAWAQKHLDHLRRSLMLEPRGHADMYGALLTEPVSAGAHAGVLFMHNEGWSTMCGHGIIAVTTIAIERELIWPGGPALVLDSPAGRIEARATMGDADGRSRVAAVAFRNVPSFVARGRPAGEGRRPHHPGRRRIRRRVLRHRGCRSRGAGDRPGDAAGTAAGRDGDQGRSRAAAAGGPSPGQRPARDLRHDFHGAGPAPRRASAQRHDLRRCGSGPIAVRHGHGRGDGGAQRDGRARRRHPVRAREHRRHALHRDASSGGRRWATSRRSCRRSRARPGSPASTRS